MEERIVQPSPIILDNPRNPLVVFGAVFGAALALVFVLIGLIVARAQFLLGAQFVAYAIIAIMVVGIPGAIILSGVLLYLAYRRRARVAELEVLRAERQITREDELNAARIEQLQAQTDVLRRTIAFDHQGNAGLLDAYGQVQVLRGNMREHPGLHTYHNSPHITGVTEQAQEGQKLLAPVDIRIPTFREALDANLIGPGQRQVLICHELERDEDTGELTGEMAPYMGSLSDNSTNFLGGGSKSGKSTYMTHISAQGALMNALYYIIDPHLNHPEKSVARKLEALSHSFILPPAMTDLEVMRVLQHMQAEAYARVNLIETPYSDRPIVVVIDEVLALMARAQRSTNKEVQSLYRELALFMRDLGTQYNKFDINGVFASQYITKDAFKLPGGSVDFRDGCQNQTLLRLPANQAQAMRLLDSSQLRGVRQLPAGHGYMGFASGDLIRMASGDVSRQDIEYVAQLTAPSPDRKKQYAVPASESPALSSKETHRAEMPEPIHMSEPVGRSVQGTESGTTWVLDGYCAGTESTPPVQGTESGTEVVPPFKKTFTDSEELTFWTHYQEKKSIKKALADMHVSYGDYQVYASWLVRNKRKQG